MQPAATVDKRISSEEQLVPPNNWSRLLQALFGAPRPILLAITLGIATLIAILDWSIERNISLGILYAIPIALAAISMNRWQLLLMVAVCSFLREHFSPFSWEADASHRVFYALLSFGGFGFLVHELALNRRLVLEHYDAMQEQIDLRREAENQLLTLIESSPAAIITLAPGGAIELANQAAHEMLGVEAGSLIGQPVGRFLPVLSDIAQAGGNEQPYRTATNCRGRRSNGESFLACVWFATYPTRNGNRLAAIVTDSSEDLRDWQETSLQSLLRSTRVLVGSVSHEIRNICAAISVVHANLGRIPSVAATEDYQALGTLAQGLARLATVELSQSSGDVELGSVNLESLLDEYRIIIEPTLQAAETELTMDVPGDLPAVVGDHHGLLQVLLNLGRNSARAMEKVTTRRLKVVAEAKGETVLIRVSDSGPGISHPERLFQPFMHGADAVGLGLFVSRAIVRACQGELYHEPTPTGATLVLRLLVFPADDSAGELNSTEMHA